MKLWAMRNKSYHGSDHNDDLWVDTSSNLLFYPFPPLTGVVLDISASICDLGSYFGDVSLNRLACSWILESFSSSLISSSVAWAFSLRGRFRYAPSLRNEIPFPLWLPIT